MSLKKELLAEAANHLLIALHEGHLVHMPIQSVSQPATEYEDEEVREVQDWIAEQGFTPETQNMSCYQQMAPSIR